MAQAETIQDEPVSVQDNPIRQGNCAPVEDGMTVHDLAVEGTVPAALNGALLRDGPNPIDPGPGHHWFMGDGMVHGIKISDGRATAYRNRWARTPRKELIWYKI